MTSTPRPLPAALAILLLTACNGLADTVVASQHGPLKVETVAQGLEHPWGLAFLPDGRMLVTERPGRLRVVDTDGSVSAPLAGVPGVYASGQGGLLDVALSPDFLVDRLVYLSFAEPGAGGAGTAVARGRLSDDGSALERTETIFRQVPKVGGGRHFGSRLAFAPDGRLFVTLGDRGQDSLSQDPADHIGTIVRIEADGAVPPDNPFVGTPGARPEIWSFGHRNGQGAALHPETGVLWQHEHGPRGGDELNIPTRGGNHGWPLVSWGDHYSGQPIPKPPTRPDLHAPIAHWVPAIAPSGMAFHGGDLFVGSLVAQVLIRLELDGERVTGEERIPLGARIRDVRSGPDGALYLLTDERDGKLLRLAPTTDRR